MDYRANKAPPSVPDGGDSQRRRRRAHSFSSSLLDAICQSMELGEDYHTRRGDHDAQDGRVSNLNSHHHVKVKMSKPQRTKPSTAHREIVVLRAGRGTSFRLDEAANVEKPIDPMPPPSSSSSSIISNFSYSDSSSLGQLSTSGSSYGRCDASSSCSKKPRGDRMGSIKEKMARAKLRAIKFCSELNKARSNPISPRCPIATYLNSLFNARKDSKKSSAKPVVQVPKPTYSSLHLIKPPSTCIVSGSRSDGPAPMMQGREVFRRCQEKIVRGLKMREFIEEAEGDDTESYASSDLFELETLIVGGEELPVFETTDIKTNQAIANRFSM